MHRRSNPSPNPGDSLRDQVADLLSPQYGAAKTEYRENGKKIDVYFEHRDFGKTQKIYVEAKDYSRPLSRKEVVEIKSDYEGILSKGGPSILLIVTKSGLSADAQSYIDNEISYCRHQTIWEIENSLIDLEDYLRYLKEEYEDSGLSEYYVENGFEIRESTHAEHQEHIRNTAKIFDDKTSCFAALENWVKIKDENTPVAILGGYGTGKTSLATRLAAHLAQLALQDNYARQPIVIRLGGIYQYSNIEGILGAYFTNTFPLRNYNSRSFMKLNAKGRYVLILDGFDEMKHSMTWSEFQLQIKDLLRLHNERSKIILLGRPSAFLSETEDRHVLKGEKPYGEHQWRKLADWPRFHELEISNFTDDQRADFITFYLLHTSKTHSSGEIEQRALLTNEIAEQDPELYQKPVHTKIITDLARDPNFDLTQFKHASSRWFLYKEFVTSLYEREAEKRSRSDISTERRIKFLQDLAFWLWKDKGASISFQVDQIPASLYQDIPRDDLDDPLPLCRELLVGSILERKSSNVFFFGHRSFAEFMVAQRMLNSEPSSRDHELYSQVFQDGVKEFLNDADHERITEGWYNSFNAARGNITQNYLEFLSAGHKGMSGFRQKLHASSPWRTILRPYKSDLNPTRENYQATFRGIFESDSLSFSWQYCWINQLDSEGWRDTEKLAGRGQGQFDRQILLCLINSLFSNLSNVDRNLFVLPRHAGLRRICHEAITLNEFSDGSHEFAWSHSKLSNACHKELNNNGFQWEMEPLTEERPITIKLDDIFSRLTSVAQDNLLIHLRFVRSWSSITERADPSESRKDRKSEISRRNRPRRMKLPKKNGRSFQR